MSMSQLISTPCYFGLPKYATRIYFFKETLCCVINISCPSKRISKLWDWDTFPAKKLTITKASFHCLKSFQTSTWSMTRTERSFMICAKSFTDSTICKSNRDVVRFAHRNQEKLALLLGTNNCNRHKYLCNFSFPFCWHSLVLLQLIHVCAAEALHYTKTLQHEVEDRESKGLKKK